MSTIDIKRPRTTKRRGRPPGSIAAKTIAMREAILALTAEHKEMTLRGVFYALTTTGIVPKTKEGYRAVGRQVLAMRREDVLPWDFITDATRWMRKPGSFDSVDDALQEVSLGYRRNLWQSQGIRIEVWLEKDALAGIVMNATRAWDVPLMVSRGVSSATFLYFGAEAAREAWEKAGISTHILALYDYDAGGMRASRNVEEGLPEHAPGVPITFRQLAVTPEQIEEWNLPTRPAIKSDPEAAKVSDLAVELDAIPPHRLIKLVEDAIVALIDPRAWKIEQLVQDEERRGLEALINGYLGPPR